MSANITAEPKQASIPLSVRLLGTVSSPIIVALALATILTAGYLFGDFQTGHLQRVLDGTEDSLGTRATATLFVLIAYVPLAHLFLCRWTQQHLAALRASFGAVITFERSAPAGIGAGILGAAIFLSLFIVIPILFAGSPEMSFEFIAATVAGTAFGWLAGRFSACMVRDALRMSALARALPTLDLFDLEPLSPIVQQGLKSALLVVMIPVLSSHLSVAPGNRVVGAAAYLLIWCALTLVAFTLPAKGVNERILSEKRSQLRAIRSEIRGAKEQVVDQRSEATGNRLSALLDLEVRLERVREWPYDASNWRRFGLYILLGLGSWVGAATVERLLNLAF